jgi:signal transduction histidine kinase
MTDLRLQKPIGQDDREALEHIARALEGRVLSSPAAVGAPANVNDDTSSAGASSSSEAAGEGADEPEGIPQLNSAGVETLIEAMPAAIGILKGDTLNTVNSAFAYAFGYRSPAELIDAGGLDAILPGGLADLAGRPLREPIRGIAALTRSRRRLSVTFILTPLDGDARLRLLRLVDPSDLEPETPAPETPAPETPAPETPAPETLAPATPEPLPAARAADAEPPRPETSTQTSNTDTSSTATASAELSVDRSAAPSAAAEASPETEATSEPLPLLAEPAQSDPEVAPAEAAGNVKADEAAKAAAEAEDLRARTREIAARQLDFLAKVSHEVRTPLNSIIGFAELMLHERFGPIGNTRYKGYAEDIHQSGLYALSLLNDLLDISKIEAGKFELDFTSVDVGEVVDACVASLQPLAKRTRIVLRSSFADDLPLVLADPRRLRQILLNLLTNAIKFTREGGQVIVSGTMVDSELRLRVRDSGVGMSENDIAYAMQPFNQLDTSPRHQAGTGLGLPLTKALTDAIRARLELTSEPGVGTSADVIFPKERLFRR